MRRLARSTRALIAVALLSACATAPGTPASVQGQEHEREQELRSLRSDLATLRATVERVQSSGDRVAAQLHRTVQQQARESAARIDALAAELGPLSAALAALTARVEALAGRADEDAATARAEERLIAGTVDALARHLMTLTELVAGVDARVASLQQELAALSSAVPRRHTPGTEVTAATPSDQTNDLAASPAPAERPPSTASPSDILGGLEKPPITGSETASPPATASAPAAAPPERPIAGQGAGASRAREIYDSAYLDFSRGSYVLAIGGFGELLRRFPDDPLAGNAQYWIGEAYWGLARSYEQSQQVEHAADARRTAAEELAKVAERYRHSDKAPVALYRQALILLELGETEQARQRLQQVVDAFPQAAESRLAREQLSREPE